MQRPQSFSISHSAGILQVPLRWAELWQLWIWKRCFSTIVPSKWMTCVCSAVVSHLLFSETNMAFRAAELDQENRKVGPAVQLWPILTFTVAIAVRAPSAGCHKWQPINTPYLTDFFSKHLEGSKVKTNKEISKKGVHRPSSSKGASAGQLTPSCWTYTPLGDSYHFMMIWE